MSPSSHNRLPFGSNKKTFSKEEIQEIIEHLDQAEFDQDKSPQSADYREKALAVMADTDVDEGLRQEVADRLERVDNRMAIRNVDPEDSY
jgi:hypothetical protein